MKQSYVPCRASVLVVRGSKQTDPCTQNTWGDEALLWPCCASRFTWVCNLSGGINCLGAKITQPVCNRPGTRIWTSTSQLVRHLFILSWIHSHAQQTFIELLLFDGWCCAQLQGCSDGEDSAPPFLNLITHCAHPDLLFSTMNVSSNKTNLRKWPQVHSAGPRPETLDKAQRHRSFSNSWRWLS